MIGQPRKAVAQYAAGGAGGGAANNSGFPNKYLIP